jgi:S-adenosylmethionine:tRNA ribosyltransferase-isomerase
MRLVDFDYELPPDLVAQEPAPRRDAARLMILDRDRDGVAETAFTRLVDHLHGGDLLVVNDTRVLPARLQARKESGGRVEVLLVAREPDDEDGGSWRCMVSTSRGLRSGARLTVAEGLEIEVLGEAPGGRFRIRLRSADGDADRALHKHGMMPVPPYIRRDPWDPRGRMDLERYQTVYARHEGAIAAPTAGLHFTPALLHALEKHGVRLARLTLHVGPGTFQPVRAEVIEHHRLESEAFRLPAATAEAVAHCRSGGGRVVAVGTTVTRVLEASAREDGSVLPGEGRCGLYITPGHRFRVVDALVTNFHLPRSSLLILVAAFAGRERILAAYAEAVRRRFRFYSYGDAMVIL